VSPESRRAPVKCAFKADKRPNEQRTGYSRYYYKIVLVHSVFALMHGSHWYRP